MLSGKHNSISNIVIDDFLDTDKRFISFSNDTIGDDFDILNCEFMEHYDSVFLETELFFQDPAFAYIFDSESAMNQINKKSSKHFCFNSSNKKRINAQRITGNCNKLPIVVSITCPLFDGPFSYSVVKVRHPYHCLLYAYKLLGKEIIAKSTLVISDY